MALYDRFLKKPPKQSRSRAVVDSVLTAATELLGRSDDEDEVTIQAVADRAGVGIGSLYDYFVDRGSVFSGLAAKLTEDNLRRFEEVLAATRTAPLAACVERLVDLLFDTYLADPRVLRIVLKVAHRANLMPSLAASQAAAARALAAELRQRKDGTYTDPDLAAFTLVNMAMGVVHTLIWTVPRPANEAAIRRELVKACLAYLER